MSATNDEVKCEDRIKAHYAGRMGDIFGLWQLNQGEKLPRKEIKALFDGLGVVVNLDDEAAVTKSAHALFNEYGLAWDYVAAGTFKDQRRGYFRWRLSTGGPGDEFRFFTDETLSLCRVEYWFLDWSDGARRVVRRGRDFELLEEIWDELKDLEMPQYWMEQVTRTGGSKNESLGA